MLRNTLNVLEDTSELRRQFRSDMHASGGGAGARAGPYKIERERCDILVSKGRQLRAEIAIPRDASGANRRVALVCTHPWAVMGGSKENNVPSYLTMSLARFGFVTAKFDFRNGTFTRGWGEMEDVKAVCRHLQSLSEPPTSIFLIGYSYGSMIANAVVDEMDVIKGFVGISTPFSVFWALSLFNGSKLLKKSHSSKDKLLIMGTSDNFTSESAFRARFDEFPGPKMGILVPDMDHFWFDNEWILFSLILKWLNKDDVAGSASETSKNATAEQLPAL